ncbi:glycoside hydrolase family 27 protein [Mycolicibacterium fluoranthenivorans]|uniref:Alpha-galactosidase n=1 Tax=Mycolicibacterium fluoranthenivorans TaxID=258505 RepID=A0A7X5ZGG9_9MYCO|nr:glycoside hydrolase family 27 protein [Mycolicibacterium fluoranthenivorans]MCV7356380.1 glycoside hydrolase family 27 protein [Mycolicibacterium fluoranthenivorans]NIH99236.1 alpha-galactosidase [Mycolicibacterium fluoranthenivorans]
MRRLLCVLGVAAVVSGCAYPADVTIPAPPVLLPPMGWNSWNSGMEIDDQSIRDTIDAMVSSGMRDAGYTYVNLDAGWAAPERNSSGELVPDPQRFPFGLAPLVDYAHERGLRFGLYSSPFNETCGQGVGTASLGHETVDAATFAAWGIDFLKYDWCSAAADHDEQVQVFGAMGSALRDSGRRIVYSINPNSSGDPAAGTRFDWTGIADVVRTSGDLVPLWRNVLPMPGDADPFPSGMFAGVPDQFAAAVAADDRPAYRIDPDMLVVGVTWSDFFLRHRELLRHNLKSQPLTADQRALIEPMLAMPARTAQWIADTQPSLTEDEQRSHFSLWAMLGAPLLAGNDLRAMSPTTLSILTNREVIAVDQDPLLAKARRIGDDGRIWAKRLADSSVAVALFNPSSVPGDIATTAAAVGLPPASCYSVRDLWTGDSAEVTGDLSARSVAPHAVHLVRVRTADTCSH